MSLSIKNLNKSFGDVSALCDINLSLNQGELAALVGPSGCGKTTLLRSIAGLEHASSGQIKINEHSVFDSELNESVAIQDRKLGMVFQDFALWPHLTVYENVAFGLRARKDTKDLDKRVNDALAQVHLDSFAKRFPSQLSGGQQQRVSIARAIVTKPQLILLDEPLSALDAVLKDQIQHLLLQILKDNQLTAVYVTHDQAEAMSMADKVVIMNAGQVEQFDSPEAIYHHPKSEFVAQFIGKSNRLPSPQGHAFIRMEKLKPHAAANDNDLQFEGSIINARFQGQHYLVEANVAGEKWHFFASQRPTPGEIVSLYCAPEDIQRIHL